jgi:hypothetical protein
MPAGRANGVAVALRGRVVRFRGGRGSPADAPVRPSEAACGGIVENPDGNALTRPLGRDSRARPLGRRWKLRGTMPYPPNNVLRIEKRKDAGRKERQYIVPGTTGASLAPPPVVQ